MTRHMGLWVLCLAVAGAAPAAAQTTTDTYEWTRRLTASAFAGVATSGSRAGAEAGAGIGWGVGRRVIVEGSATWFDRPAGSEAFAATLTAQVHLSTRLPALPYVEAGAGMYSATFDTSRATPPGFYGRRIGPGGPGGRERFRDPAIVFGGGVHLVVARHVGLRPEVKTLIVLDGGHAHAVTAVAMRVAYYFEPRAVTPDRR